MPVKWIQSGQKGVRYYEHDKRKYEDGAIKRLDRYYAIRYQYQGKRIEEGLGWASAGWTVDKAFVKLTELRAAATESSDAPTRLAEERARRAEKKREAAEEKKRQEEEKEKQKKGAVTVEDFFYDTYLPKVKPDRKGPGRLKDEGHFSLWLSPVIGEKPIKDVTSFDLERVKRNMQAKKKSPRTIQYVFATFRQIWNMARKTKITPGGSSTIVTGASPTLEVSLTKVKNERDRFLSHEEADALLADLRVRDVETCHMAALSLYTGMRASEIFRLTWREIELNKGTIRIADTKNDETRRAYITAPVKDVLDQLTKGKPNDHLFTQKNGGPYTEAPKAFRDAVKAIGFNKGLEDRRQRVCFHTLRHTFASWLAEQNVDLYAIGKLLGHKTPSMTKRYAHLGDNILKAAAMKLESVQVQAATNTHSEEIAQ